MPTTTNKQRVLTQLFGTAKNRYQPAEARPVLEEFLYALCREGTTHELADRAYDNLKQRFFDWNEIRVSSIREVEEALGDLPDAEKRAERLINLLQEVFETTFSFDLESLHKKGLKQAAKHLARFQASSEYAVAWVVQRTLGGHAIPVDAPSMRCLRRLGLVDEDQADADALRASLEHLIPKAKGPLFNEMLSTVAFEFCEEEPNCPSCPLAGECPTGQEATRGAVAAGRGSRPKPR